MIVMTHSATGSLLGYLVAMAIKKDVELTSPGVSDWHDGPALIFWDAEKEQPEEFVPWLSWAQGGPILENAGVWFEKSLHPTSGKVFAYVGDADQPIRTANTYSYGPDRLTAGLRCLVATKFGTIVEVPDELMAKAVCKVEA